MDQHIVELEFFCHPNGGKNVVRSVTMHMHQHFALHHRQQRFKTGVKFRFILFGIAPGFFQVLPNHRHRRHAGGRGEFSLAVEHFGVFAKCHFHRHRVFDHQLIKTQAALGFHSEKLPANGVGRAGSGDHSGDAGGAGLGKTRLAGVGAVDGPQVRGDGICHFIQIAAPCTVNFLLHTDMGVGVDETGVDGVAGVIGDLVALLGLGRRRGTNRHNFSVFEGHKSFFDGGALPFVDGGIHKKFHARAPFPLLMFCKKPQAVRLRLLWFD